MKRLFIFASYDKDNIIDDYVVYYVKELSRTGDVIFIIDNDLPDAELNKIEPYVLYCVAQRHGEYDFGSYKRGFLYVRESHILPNYDWLILCNDSVYGPFYDLEPIFIKMERENHDVWGFTKNTKPEIEHLQSYFIAMSSKVFNHPEVQDFLCSIERKEKKKVVKLYEFGISQLFSNLGFRFDSVYPNDKHFRNDPQKRKYLKMIKNGFPFLKRMLLTLNEHSVAHLYRYKEIKNLVPVYPFEYIKNNLVRVIDADVLQKNLHRKRISDVLSRTKSRIKSILRFYIRR